MKVACSSAPFDVAIASRRLTQLEWLDVCARELDVDGVVFEQAHFPRTDDDYVAQLRKMAVDLGLTVVALACDAPFGPLGDDPSRDAWSAVAAGLGAPIAIGRAPGWQDDPGAWNSLVSSVRDCAREGKRRNLTLAMRNAAGTLCASGADLKRLAKDVDSAWLRFALDPEALDPPESIDALLPKAVIAIVAGGDGARSLRAFRPFVLVECVADDEPLATLGAAVRAARAAAVA